MWGNLSPQRLDPFSDIPTHIKPLWSLFVLGEGCYDESSKA
jgi:hypothetical protein